MDILICTIGLLLHWAMKWAEYRRDFEKVGAYVYLKTVPAQTLVSVLASAGAFMVTYEMEWLNAGMAFACGYMGNSIADNLASRYDVIDGPAK